MFGDLRADLYGMTPSAERESVLAVYDGIVRDSELRRGFVKNFQEFLASLGLYRGTVDGIWGPYTESALLSWQPQMAGRCTRLEDILGMPRGVPEDFPSLPHLETADLIAAGIDRDLWLSDNCGGVVSETEALKEDAGLPIGSTLFSRILLGTALFGAGLGMGWLIWGRRRMA